MNIQILKSIVFSPTGTTRKIVECIAAGLKIPSMDLIDLTKPILHKADSPDRDCLTLIGVPVYGGRVPPIALKRLSRFTGNGGPAAIVVVYGNRAFEDALLELRDFASDHGYQPVSGAAFIGEHSFSTAEKPIAAKRPDADDCKKAKEFGQRLRIKLSKIPIMADQPLLRVPGGVPYRQFTPPKASPVTNETLCIKCGACAEGCTTGAIQIDNSILTDSSKCIACCACVKVCPTEARQINDKHLIMIAEWLHDNCQTPKSPEFFW
jgi:ferredoxin